MAEEHERANENERVLTGLLHPDATDGVKAQVETL
jgi:hypothetical protein